MKTILQVEDDPNDVFLLRRAMDRVGFMNPVQVANDGQQAIDYLRGVRQFADRGKFPLPCLVLLDLKLPCVTGLEVLREIRKRPGTALTVVILTSSEQDADITAAYRLGANAFLTKPSEVTKLEEMMKSIKDFWLTHNTMPDASLVESPMDGVVSLGHSSTADFVAPTPTAPAGVLRTHWFDQLDAIRNDIQVVGEAKDGLH